jgi:uncharacterized membrane protein
MTDKTIGNPLSWIFGRAADAGGHVEAIGERILGLDETEVETPPIVQKISYADIRTALQKGWADFSYFRSDVLFLCLLYPIIGMVLIWVAFDKQLVPLLAPIVMGFALLGPLAAVGLYEMSRRREAGLDASWMNIFDIIRAKSFGAILALGFILVAFFVMWLLVAQGIYAFTLGIDGAQQPLGAFMSDVFNSTQGRIMAVVGILAGSIFAVGVLFMSVVSFPMMLHRRASLATAVGTSIEVSCKNPRVVLTWGFIVAASLALGSIPALLGLVFVLPVLGHATWHLYRLAVK